MNANFREGGLPSKIFALGQSEFERLTNSEVSELFGVENTGQVWNARNAVALKTGWKLGDDSGERKPRQSSGDKPRKLKGSLPLKLAGFIESQLDCEEGEVTPESALTVVIEDSVAWNKLIRRMNDASPEAIESFELWLGHGATVSRHSDFVRGARVSEMESKMTNILDIIGSDTELAALLLATLTAKNNLAIFDNREVW
jgi:hypothetical protein